MQIKFNEKAGYYGRNRKGISVGVEVMTFNGEIIIRPINSRGVTNSCSIGVGSVSDALMLAEEIRKQAMAMVKTPDTVCNWLIYMNDAEDADINEILSSAPLSVLGEAATSKTQAIGIGYEYSPELFKPLYNRYVADQTTVILQQVVDSNILFSQLQDTYKAKLIAEIKSKLTNEWVKLDDEFELNVEGNKYVAQEISIEGLNCETSYGDTEIVDFFDMSIDSLEYIQPKIILDGFVEPQKEQAPDTTPLWDSIPLEYKFVTIDSDGEELAHIDTPEPLEDYWRSEFIKFRTGRFFDMAGIKWDETLSVRP